MGPREPDFLRVCELAGWFLPVLQLSGRHGRASVSVFGKELHASLIECECMAEVADVFHAFDGPREHVLPTCNPNRRNRIPKVLS